MKILKKIFIISFFLILAAGCRKNENMELDVVLNIPSSIVVESGEMEVSFRIVGSAKPEATDRIEFSSASAGAVTCDLSVDDRYVRVILPGDFKSGEYSVSIIRASARKLLGKTTILISDSSGTEIDENTTVYGFVSCDGKGVPGVAVSDGKEVVVTDESGFYQIASDKKKGYVFISVPSGYEVPSDGILPQFHKTLSAPESELEAVNFTLNAVEGQERFKLLVFGDMHLANRTGDLSQFKDFADDVNAYVKSNSGSKIYALTLGDMTWDLYWYSNNYAFAQYLTQMNLSFNGLQVYHTMGNHDNDFKTTGDFEAESKYINSIAPTYYSFNIGEVHFVVVDDIDCSKYDGTESRNYFKALNDEQLSWLEKDLSHVDKTRPVILSTHAQIFYPRNSSSSPFKIDHDTAGTNRLFEILSGYEVHFLTGHTHHIFNVTPGDAITSGQNFHEHNAGSVCASWWWSGHLTQGIHISPDGTPGGYSVWDIDGADMKWSYKATGRDEDYQFRSYDLNNVSFSYSDVPNLVNETQKEVFRKYVDAYPDRNDNVVLINIWNWSKDWKLEVTDESGKVLGYEKVWAYDPLHIAALTVKRFNADISSTPSFTTVEWPHFFKVTAPDADEDLKISVTDEFGNVYVENMARPKAFSTDAYR